MAVRHEAYEGPPHVKTQVVVKSERLINESDRRGFSLPKEYLQVLSIVDHSEVKVALLSEVEAAWIHCFLEKHSSNARLNSTFRISPWYFGELLHYYKGIVFINGQ